MYKYHHLFVGLQSVALLFIRKFRLLLTCCHQAIRAKVPKGTWPPTEDTHAIAPAIDIRCLEAREFVAMVGGVFALASLWMFGFLYRWIWWYSIALISSCPFAGRQPSFQHLQQLSYFQQPWSQHVRMNIPVPVALLQTDMQIRSKWFRSHQSQISVPNHCLQIDG